MGGEPSPTPVQGSLVEVGGIGVLLVGRSGIGKSECALELVMRGHRLVADDVVLVTREQDGRAWGTSPELVRHYMELRGIGIVHVPSLFGEGSVLARAPIDLVLKLEAWGAGEVERLGLDRHTEWVAGSEVEAMHIPVAPGRNLASLAEVAARKHRLLAEGRSGAVDLDDRLARALRKEEP